MIFAEVENYLSYKYIFIKLWNCLPLSLSRVYTLRTTERLPARVVTKPYPHTCVRTQDHREATGPCCHRTLPSHANMSPTVLHCLVYTLIGLLQVLQGYFSPNVPFFCCCPLQFLTILIFPFK